MAKFGFLGLAVAGAIPLVAPAAAEAALVSARGGDLGAFSGGVQQVNGTFTAVGPAHGADGQTFAATYSGAGGGGQASGTFNVAWRQGQSSRTAASSICPRTSTRADRSAGSARMGQPPRAVDGSSAAGWRGDRLQRQCRVPGGRHRHERVRHAAGAGRSVSTFRSGRGSRFRSDSCWAPAQPPTATYTWTASSWPPRRLPRSPVSRSTDVRYGIVAAHPGRGAGPGFARLRSGERGGVHRLRRSARGRSVHHPADRHGCRFLS